MPVLQEDAGEIARRQPSVIRQRLAAGKDAAVSQRLAGNLG